MVDAEFCKFFCVIFGQAGNLEYTYAACISSSALRQLGQLTQTLECEVQMQVLTP